MNIHENQNKIVKWQMHEHLYKNVNENMFLLLIWFFNPFKMTVQSFGLYSILMIQMLFLPYSTGIWPYIRKVGKSLNVCSKLQARYLNSSKVGLKITMGRLW